MNLDTVKGAARFLDVVSPLWYQRIDTEKLDMAVSSKCILGQLYGRYSNVSRAYTGFNDMFGGSLRLVKEDEQERADLKKKWVKQIEKRRVLAEQFEDGLLKDSGTLINRV